ncbi:MAG: hypothetical protein VB055_01850 [Oscillospiraceae bacterium]|nr:hypothetical protein [Oscillospiraceae bacterium]
MDKNYMSVWKKNAIRIGTPTNLIAAFTAFIPVIYLCSTYHCWPNLTVVLSAWGLVALSFGAFYVVEPVSYYASLGMAGTYLSFLSGNIGNMRVPCAALALDVTKSEAGTIQAEVVSTMAICGSIITNLIATTAAALVGTAVVAVLPEFINVGLKTYASAAIFGATFGNFALKKPKVAVFGIGIPLIFKLFIPVPTWLIIVVSVFGTVAISRLFYVKEKSAKKN